VKLPRWPLHKSGAFGKLLSVRWLGQLSDGIFQSALASFVLFSPERQPNAIAAAAAFSVVLLPYSVVGPYVGVLLDRFSRSRIIAFANLLRAADLIIIAFLIHNSSTGLVLTLFVLIAFGINRLILAGLSAGLPLVVTKDELITSNALAVTGGTLCVVLGGGIGVGVKNLLDKNYATDISDALLIAIACGAYLLAALLTTRLGKKGIGPLAHEMTSDIQGFSEMVAGFKTLKAHGDALRGIFAIAIQRGGITALTLMTLLLQRNTFNPSSDPDAGLRGFAFTLALAGVGVALGSFLSPIGVLKLGRHYWIKLSLVAPIPFLLLFALIPNRFTLAVAAFFIGGFGQSVKVSNDALVQSKISDIYRGRVFAFYDVAVNGAIVSGAIIAALVLPTSGKSLTLPLLISAAYLITNLTVLKRASFSGHSHPTT
jgi:MFS family permease